jgi:hypothetical protein
LESDNPKENPKKVTTQNSKAMEKHTHTHIINSGPKSSKTKQKRIVSSLIKILW